MKLHEVLALVGFGLIFLAFGLGGIGTLAASLYAGRARKLGFEVVPSCRPLALWAIGWPATFDLLETEARRSRRDRVLRVLYRIVAAVNRATVAAIALAGLLAVVGYLLSK